MTTQRLDKSIAAGELPPSPADVNLTVVDVARGISTISRKSAADQIQLMDTIRRAAVSYTSSEQWCDFGGKPYMEGDAACSIAFVLGLSVSEPRYERKELPGSGPGGSTAVQIKATISAVRNGRTFTDHGDCDSFDSFLLSKRRELEKNGASPQAIAMICESEIEKKAAANARSRAVSGWIGLRGVSWEDLARLGLKREDAGGRVDFRVGNAQRSETPTSHKTIVEALQLPVGSKIAISARVTRIDRKDGKKGPYCTLGVRDATDGMWVRMWKAAPEWLVEGGNVTFPEIEICEYAGKPQYVARKIEQVDSETKEISDDAESKQSPVGTGAAATDAADKWEDARGAGSPAYND